MDSHTGMVDGIAMRWEEEGDGLPLVLVHGIPTCPALWRHLVPRITGARCLAWEMVGYGGSIPEGRSRDISIARQADHLLAWLNTIGVERAVFAGHDLGGGVRWPARRSISDEAALACRTSISNTYSAGRWP